MTVLAFTGAATAFVPASADPEAFEKLVPGALGGEIDVVSYGHGRLSGDRTTHLTVLHVRQTFANRGDDLPWVVDFTGASITLDRGTPPIRPVLVNTDARTLPLLFVERGERRVADLFFAVPAHRVDERLDTFAVTFRIHTADHRYEATTTLARSLYEPTRQERGLEVGGASAWWADPSYAWSEYERRSGPVVPRPPKRIEVVQAPRAYYVATTTPVEEESLPTDECNQW
jgi:hypothetical protein